MIQQGINQLLSTAGVFARLSPTLEARALSHQRNKEMQNKATAVSLARSAGDTDLATSINEEIADIATQEFEANPTEQTYSVLANIRREMSPETVMQDLAGRAQQSVTQAQKRRYFMDYLREQPTSFGGTVGELPHKVQRQIAGEYSRKERKALMDRIDKERGNG